jgi:hypothetical protein
MKNVKVERCLLDIARRHGGMLLPEVVVAEAKNPRHPLHGRFTWNPDEAAHQWNLHEARMLINVVVSVIRHDLPPMPVFCSLTTDRSDGRGYRVTASVMGDSELRDQLLQDALAQLNSFTQKFQQLRELAEVFKAIKKVKSKAA